MAKSKTIEKFIVFDTGGIPVAFNANLRDVILAITRYLRRKFASR